MSARNDLLNSQSGATLIETVVAIALTSIILTAIMAMVITAVSTSTNSKSRTAATRYAEEGTDTVRTVRDSLNWSDFYQTYIKNQGSTIWYVTCSYSLTTTAPVAGVCSSDSGLAVYIIPYTRQIKILDDSTSGNKDRAIVDVTVTWNNHGKTENVELVTYLTNWVK
jgi:type II secretory pathway pseudopilin PulG